MKSCRSLLSGRKREKYESDLIDQCNILKKANEELQVSGRKMEIEMMALRRRHLPKPDDS